MIKSIAVENIRIFEHPQTLSIYPLTAFCGTNSSGKSTLLKIMSLLRQSQGVGETEIANGRLRFNGSQVELGDYISFVSHNDLQRDIHITVVFQDKMPVDRFTRLWRLSADTRGTQIPVEFIGSQAPYTIEAIFTFSALRLIDTDKERLTPNQKPLSGEPISGVLREATYSLKYQDRVLVSCGVIVSTFDEENGVEEAFYNLILPSIYIDLTDGFEKVIPQAQNQGRVLYTTTLRGLIPHRIIAQTRLTKSEDLEWRVFPLPHYIEEMLQDLQASLASIEYLGPLRSPAKRYYIAQDAGRGIDPVGEFLPQILRDKRDKKVQNILPGQPEAFEQSLTSALNSWLHYLRTGSVLQDSEIDREIIVHITREVLVEFKINSPSGVEQHALTDSGFGYSQVLPILVRGLLVRENGTLVVEQPELHLNPALQVRLAGFFVAMVKMGKQVLIETHSEHIVNAIRVIAAEDLQGELAGKCGIFYIGFHQGKLTVNDMAIQADGTLMEWPPEFFGEAAALVSRLLRAQKKLRSRND